VEAKKLGIKTGFGLREARGLAPNLIALEVDPPKIRTTTKKIFSIFADFTSAIEEYSIDEAFLDLTGIAKNFAEAKLIAANIKERIIREVGEWLKCSIGIAETKWLAKFAGEMQKPDGLTVLKKEDLPFVYFRRPVDEAWGINKGWKNKLSKLGINTLDELLKADPLELKRIFGLSGFFLWSNIAGVDLEKIKSPFAAQQKSIGHSYVFHKRTDEAKEILRIIMKLCEKAGRRLRHARLEARGIAAFWRYPNDGDGGRAVCGQPVSGSYEIFDVCKKIFLTKWNGEKTVFFAINTFNLAPFSGQESFLNDHWKKQNINRALDAVNDRYGEYTVIYGQMWGINESAPDRVGFRQSVKIMQNHDNISLNDEDIN
jgi:DNA polymerase-4